LNNLSNRRIDHRLVMVQVRQNGESSLINSEISNRCVVTLHLLPTRAILKPFSCPRGLFKFQRFMFMVEGLGCAGGWTLDLLFESTPCTLSGGGR